MRRGPLHRWLHRVLQRPYRHVGMRFKTFASHDHILEQIAARQHRIYDLPMLRQALTLSLIREYEDSPRGPIVVIGDGFGTLASLVLSVLPESRVVLVNLTKSLLVDLLYCRMALPGLGLALAEDESSYRQAIADAKARLIAVRADQCSVIGTAPIGWAVNVASMQEMDPPVIARYFELLRRAGCGLFYCCNRVEKVLPDGTVANFLSYPWKDEDQILLDDLCLWHQRYYTLWPPSYRRYDGPIWHRLARLAKYTCRQA